MESRHAALAAVLALAAMRPAAAQPCGDRLRAVSPTLAVAGELIELHGDFSAERGARRPMANRGGVNDLEVVQWSAQRIVARLPSGLVSGEYRVGIYCDGRHGPQRFLHSTDWLPLAVQAIPIASAGVPQTRPAAGQPALPTAAQFESWLSERPGLANELVWEGADGPEPYAAWPEARRAALYTAFARRVAGGRAEAVAPPPENLAAARNALAPEGELHQMVSAADAETLYLDAVGHSLALEYTAALPWSLLDYPPPMREILLESRAFFRLDEGGYSVPFGSAGMALPSPAAEQWAFLESRVADSRQQTIVAVLDWLRAHAMHFEGRASAATMQQQRQYPGYPPVARVLAGTPHLGRPEWPARPRTAGCFGTAGFLRALLRSANIPVEAISSCAHSQVHFPSEGLYLSHGDDPYSGDFREGRCGSDRLLIDAATFTAWFRRGPEHLRCDNVGRGAREAATCP